jgi:hypothetical protein
VAARQAPVSDTTLAPINLPAARPPRSRPSPNPKPSSTLQIPQQAGSKHHLHKLITEAARPAPQPIRPQPKPGSTRRISINDGNGCDTNRSLRDRDRSCDQRAMGAGVSPWQRGPAQLQPDPNLAESSRQIL